MDCNQLLHCDQTCRHYTIHVYNILKKEIQKIQKKKNAIKN